jgi:hypothetical protein
VISSPISVLQRFINEIAPRAGAEEVDDPVRHPAFYLEDEHIKLQAENTVFRIHPIFFTLESAEGRDLVEQASQSEDRLAKLHDVGMKDLERFCEVLYYRSVFNGSSQ